MAETTFKQFRTPYTHNVKKFATNDLEALQALGVSEESSANERIATSLQQLSDIENRVGEQAAVDRSASLSDRLSSNRDAQFERATRTMDLSGRQGRSATRRLGLSRSLNRASATGATRRGFTNRSQLASQAGQGFADALFAQQADATSALGGAEARRQGLVAQEKANKKAGKLALLGKVAGTALMFMSSENVKHDHGPEANLLDKLKKVRVNRWQYKGDDKTHVGPFAEEFNKQFGTDTDRPDMINVIDALGVTLGAVKELNEKVDARGRT